MASRRLALNLSQGLRGRAAGLAVPRRGLATPHHAPGITTQTTTLKNGLTVSPLPRPSPRAPIDQPSLSRSPRNTRPTPRPRPSACGSTPAPAQRLTRQMAPRTFSSISPSRYAPVPPPVPLRRNHPADSPRRAPRGGHSSSWSSRSRTWAPTSTPTPRFVRPPAPVPGPARDPLLTPQPARKHRLLRQGPERGRPPVRRHPARHSAKLQARGVGH